MSRAEVEISYKSLCADVLNDVKDALAKTLESNSDSRPAPVAWNVPLDTTRGTEVPASVDEVGGTWSNVLLDGIQSSIRFSLEKVYWSSDNGV